MKVGILGCGTIVPDFCRAASLVFELQAIQGLENDLENMKKIAEQYQIQHIYTSYDELLKDDIDVVYCALPNHLHYQACLKALQNGKHVICEKPYASNVEQVQELITLAKQNNLAIFEAITNQYYPNYLKTKELLPLLGDVKIVQLNYSQYSRRYDQFKAGITLPVFDPKKSGGALMDLNVYNIHYVTGLFGRPDSYHYLANIEKGIDTSGILTMSYPTFQVVCVAAKDCKAPVSVNIQGDKGFIHSDYPANVYDKFIYGPNFGDATEYDLNERKERLYYELAEFKKCVEANDLDTINAYNEHSLIVMEILVNARKEVGIEVL